MSTGGKVETPKTPARRHTVDDDDPEPVGPGPQIVLTKSNKMSIYGPKFNYGPPQLRRQRLLDKMKKEADDVLAKKIEEFTAAQAELDRKKMEEEAKQLELARQAQKQHDEAVERMRREQFEWNQYHMHMQMQYSIHDENTQGQSNNYPPEYNPMYNYKY